MTSRIAPTSENSQQFTPRLFMKVNYLKLMALICLVGLIALPRTLPFPPTFLTYDELKIGVWVSQIASGLVEGDWQKTAITNNPYPAITLAWIEAIQVEVSQLLPGQPPTKAQMLSDVEANVFAALSRRRLTLALINALLILVIGGLLRRLYNNFVAVTAMILMALDPFLLSESRSYRTEGLTTSLMMLSVLTLILYAGERRAFWLASSGMLAGLAALTRVSALFLIPFAGLVLFMWPLLAGERSVGSLLKRTTLAGLGWALMLSLTFVALWPALWASPLAGPAKLYTAIAPVFANTGRVWAKGVFFQGQTMGDVDPGPLFYLWALAYRTTPLVWMGLAAALIGAVFLLRPGNEDAKMQGHEDTRTQFYHLTPPRLLPTLFIVAYVIFYFVAINLSATKIDRYLVAMLPALSILAALGFGFITDQFFAGSERVIRWGRWGIWAGLVAGGVLFSLPHHPYYYTYWNPVLGGGQAAVKVLPAMGRQGVDVMLDYLNTRPTVSEISLAGTGLDLDFVQECPAVFVGKCLGPSQFLASNYFLNSIYSTQNEAPLANIQTVIPDVEIAHKFTWDGVDYVWLYKMPDDLQVVGHWLDLFSGSFSGYRLSDTGVGAGNTLEVTLFWQNGEKSGWRFDDSELFVKVLDETGQTQQVVPAQLKPEFVSYLSQPQAILVFTAPLHFPPDTPLGVYTLEMGLRLKATGTETLNFPLTNVVKTVTVNRGVVAASIEAWPMQHRLEQPIGETGLTLLGYDETLSKTEGDVPRFYLYWQAEKPLTENYSLKVALINDNGQSVATWSKPLSPEFHPLTAWQPGEIVKLPFPLELGYSLPPATYQVVLSVLSTDHPEAEPLATIDLSLWPKDLALPQPEVKMQHSLAEVTFDQKLDLLGYDLVGQNNSAGGRLLVTLYWLNRQPLQSVEAQVQVLAENGASSAQQLLPVPAPIGLLTWQSVSRYHLFLDTLPSSLVIRVRPVGATKWYPVQSPATPSTDGVIIDNILSKTIIAAN